MTIDPQPILLFVTFGVLAFDVLLAVFRLLFVLLLLKTALRPLAAINRKVRCKSTASNATGGNSLDPALRNMNDPVPPPPEGKVMQ